MGISKGLLFKEFKYEDIIVLQNKLTDFGVEDVDLTTQLSKNITLKAPIMSAPMDTVTESNMAIAMALQGGIGVIHYNMSVERQAEEAKKVKRFESGFIEESIVASPDTSIEEIAKIRKETHISTIPVTYDGNPHGKLAGIIHKDDYSIRIHPNLKVKDRMIPLEKLKIARWSELSNRKGQNPLEVANLILLNSHLGTLPVVDDEGNLLYLVTRADLEKNESYPNATKDAHKKLRVAIAIESRPELAMKRVEATHKFADAYVIDTSHGFATFVAKVIKEIHKKYPGKDVIAGNVSTAAAVEFLIKSGADAIKIGTGPGSICKTMDNIGVGRLQASAVFSCVRKRDELIRKYGYVPIIADGGIKEYGDFLKALALGADSVMIGSMVAGTKETPTELKEKNGRLVKEYRGMGSEESMKAGGAVRYGVEKRQIRVPEGVVIEVEYKGSVHEIMPKYAAALLQGMQKTGCKTIKELHKNAVVVPKRYM
jgi:IMP dehydrogenase